MHKLKEMLERQRTIVDAAEKEGRDLTPDEQREFDELTAKLRELAQNTGNDADESSAEGTREQDTGSSDEPDTGAAEHQRVLEIMDLCEGTSLNARELIASGASVARVRMMANEAMLREHPPIPQGEGVFREEQDKFRAAAIDAVVMRAGVELEKPAAGARDLMGMSLRDIAIRCLAAEGVASIGDLMRTQSLDLFDMAKRTYRPTFGERAFMQPTGQFPIFLDQAIEKNLVEWYKKPEYEFEKIVKIGSLSDFKAHDDNYMSGPVGDFIELPEGGTMQEDTFEYIQLGQRKLKTHAKRFSMSYQAFINDDVGALAEMPRKYARAWRRTLNKKVFSILVGNAVMGDGAKMFSGPHRNLLTKGTTVNAEAITSMRYALRNQTDQFGERIKITPARLLLPTGLDYDVATLFMSPTIETSTNTKAVNPLFNLGLETLEDATINDMAEKLGLEGVPWFMVGAADDAPGIELDYLNGQSQLQKRMGQPMDQLGFVWNFWGFAGVTAIDYRRYVMNPGIQIKPAIPTESE